MDLRALTCSRRERLATLIAALAAATGGIGLLVQGTLPWGVGPAPTGWLAGVAVAVAAVLVTAALGIRRDAAQAPGPSLELPQGAARLRRARWLRRAGHATALLSAPYALVGVVALIAEPAAAPLSAVATALPFLLGLTLLEAARRVEEGADGSDEAVEEDSWLGASPGAAARDARRSPSGPLRTRTPHRAAG